MRVALISEGEGEGAGAGEGTRTPLRVAGRTVVRRQVDLALELGCERIVCLARGPSPQIVQLERTAEKADARFHAIAGARQLAGLIKAADELLVIAPSLLADAELVAGALGGRPGILTLPAERGVAAGHERMDGEAAWAGAMLLPGALADRLADLPPDSDPFSSLLRIAMQTGTRRILLAPSALDHGELTFIGDGPARDRAEKAWLDRAKGAAGWKRPASAAVRLGARLLAPRLLVYERVVPALIAIGSLLAATGAVAAWYERPAAALGVLALAAAAFLGADTLRHFQRPRQHRPAGRKIADWAVDALFVTIAVLASPRDPQVALFSAATAILALRLVRLHGAAAPTAPFGDRILFFAFAAMAAAVGKLLPGLQVYAVAALACELFVRSKSRLTQV